MPESQTETQLIVELQKPSLLTFKGARRVPGKNKRGQLALKPGDNVVAEIDFLGAWKVDKTIHSYYETEAIRLYTLEGDRYTPPGAPSLVRGRGQKDAPKVEYRAATIPTQSPEEATPTSRSEMRPPEEAPPPEAAPAADPITPTMQGGGVPGDPAQAKAAVAAEGDLSVLEGWLANDSRDTVLKVVRKRIDALKAAE